MTDGDVWSMGDGRSIRPFRDVWIPGRYDIRLGSHPITQDQANTFLEDWIDPGLRDSVAPVFSNAVSIDELQAILVVPIPLVPRQDQLRWPYERGGCISVRSAYHRLRASDNRSIEGLDLDGSAGGPNVREAIWKSKTLPQVRVFAWKLLSNAVAVRERLLRRGVHVPLGCPICGLPETILHMLSECRWVHGIWAVLLGFSGSDIDCASSREWMARRLAEPTRPGENRSSRWCTALTASRCI